MIFDRSQKLEKNRSYPVFFISFFTILLLCSTIVYGRSRKKDEVDRGIVELIEKFIALHSDSFDNYKETPQVVIYDSSEKGYLPYTESGEINYDYPIGPIDNEIGCSPTEIILSTEEIKMIEARRKESQEIINRLKKKRQSAMQYVKDNYESSPEIYSILVDWLADSPDIPFIVSKLNNASLVEKLNFLPALIRISDKDTIPLLKTMLKDENEIVRVETCGALFVFNVVEIYPVLVELLESERQMVRNNSINLLTAKAKEDYGYDPEGDEKSRTQAVVLWKKWLKEGVDAKGSGGKSK